jgi:rare lipoprotein A
VKRQLLALLLGPMLGACASRPVPPPLSPPAQPGVIPVEDLRQDTAPRAEHIPADLHQLPDAVPRAEPRSRYGNPRQYTVLGKTYQVLPEARGYRERGGASWYGRKFHGRRTSSGEAYDMFAMTAAHKTLPLPCYVRVTHLGNGRSVVVRVNDRGPFHPGRIIDLSYAAAARLDMLQSGSAQVEVEVIDPDAEPVVASAPQSVAAPAPAADPGRPGYLIAGSFSDPVNAVLLREQLLEQKLGQVDIWTEDQRTPPLHRVVLGPFADEPSSRATRDYLSSRGLDARWVAH